MNPKDFLKIVRKNVKEDLNEQELAMFNAIGEGVSEAFRLESIERGKAIEDITTKLGLVPEGDSISEVLRSLNAKVDEMEKNAKRTLNDREKMSLRAVLEANKEIIRNGRKSGGQAWGLEFKARRTASAMMTTSTVVTGAVANNNPNEYEDMEITFIKYPKNFVLDAISSRQVAKVPESIKWKEQITAGVGVPAAVSEGNEKPLTDYKFEWKYAHRVKYAGRIEMTEETEIDFDQLMLDIINLFENDVLRKYQDGVLASITSWCNEYTTTSMDGSLILPGIHNVISAMALEIRNNEYEPDVVFINPGDYAKSLIMQDNDGAQTFLPAEIVYPGLRVFASTKIAAGTIYMGTSSVVREQHSNFMIRRGVYGNQFIENESTIVGEVFSLLKLPTESKKGWLKGNIATIINALTKAPEV